MMKDKFDKILSNKIKDVFENREVSYNPEHWDLLLVKKEKKKRRILFLWRFTGVAVIFIVIGGLSEFVFTTPVSIQKNEIEIVNEDENNLQKNNSFKSNEILDSMGVKNEIRISEINKTKYKNEALDKISEYNDHNKVEINNLIIKNTEPNITAAISPSIITKPDSLKKEIVILNLPKDDFKIAQNDLDMVKNEISDSTKIVNKQLDIQDLITNSEEKDNIYEALNKRNLKIGINISSMVSNVSGNDNTNIGFSSGVSLEIPVLKNFDIYTGIHYTNQKFDLFKQDQTLEYASISEGEHLTSREVVVKGIEIPINIKYNFVISKKKIFVSAGFSSTSSFKERTSSDYTINTITETVTTDINGNNIVQFAQSQISNTVTEQDSNSEFNLGSILNISFGMEIPVNNKRQTIVLEPYLKYSLKPVTQYNIDYTSAGIYLRYNFNFDKKSNNKL